MKPIHNLQDLADDLAQAEPGQRVAITVLRGGKPLVLHATLGARNPNWEGHGRSQGEPSSRKS